MKRSFFVVLALLACAIAGAQANIIPLTGINDDATGGLSLNALAIYLFSPVR